MTGVYPALAGSDWVSGDPDRLIRIVLHGLKGPIAVNGEQFVSATGLEMPSMGGLADEQIAEVLSFVRKAFGNGASEVSAAEVRAVRAQVESRTTPWTEPELLGR